MRLLATGAALLAVAILVIVIFDVADKGAGAITLDFFTKAPPIDGPGGGILPEIVGTLIIVGLATAFALPIGVLIAIFLTEFSTPRTAYPIRLALDLLNGLPSIVIAVFVYGLLVLGHGQTGISASIALAIIMVPLIARAAQEVLRLVPQSQRDASHALGMSKWRTTIGVVLPACVSGHRHGRRPRGRASRRRDRTRAAAQLVLQPQPGRDRNVFGQALPNIPYRDLQPVRAGEPRRPCSCMGCCTCIGGDDPDRKSHRADSACAQPEEDVSMSDAPTTRSPDAMDETTQTR